MGLFSNKKKAASDGKEINKEEKELTKVEKKEEPKKVASEEGTKNLYKDETKATETKEVKGAKIGSSSYRILVKPLITEKVTALGALNKYVFEVTRKANKIEVAKAISDVYGVKPSSVNIINVSGKKVTRGRITGKRKDWRKAIVTLPKGKTIQVYEGI